MPELFLLFLCCIWCCNNATSFESLSLVAWPQGSQCLASNAAGRAAVQPGAFPLMTPLHRASCSRISFSELAALRFSVWKLGRVWFLDFIAVLESHVSSFATATICIYFVYSRPGYLIFIYWIKINWYLYLIFTLYLILYYLFFVPQWPEQKRGPCSSSMAPLRCRSFRGPPTRWWSGSTQGATKWSKAIDTRSSLAGILFHSKSTNFFPSEVWWCFGAAK